MSVLPVLTKHKLDGIGQASAVATFAALQSTPYVGFTKGLGGKLFFWFLKTMFQFLASAGQVVLNVGVAKLETLSEQKEFDGSFDEAFKILNAKGTTLTPEEIAAIDAKVIAAHNKFGSFKRSK